MEEADESEYGDSSKEECVERMKKSLKSSKRKLKKLEKEYFQ